MAYHAACSTPCPHTSLALLLTQSQLLLTFIGWLFDCSSTSRFKGSYLFLDCQPMPAGENVVREKKRNVAKRSRTVQNSAKKKAV